VFERVKTVRALESVATVVGTSHARRTNYKNLDTVEVSKGASEMSVEGFI
jgi:hypothetical protein